jgi:uncharacterized repeat protein (TIGR01451 family)
MTNPPANDRDMCPYSRSIGSRRATVKAIVMIMMAVSYFASALTALAQVGVGFTSNGTNTGTIGHNKGGVGALQCPTGTVMRGIYHADKSMSASNSTTRGMTAAISLYCGRINITSAGLEIQNVTPDGTPTVNGYAYSQLGTVRTGYCPPGQIVQRFGGYDRYSGTQTYPFNWASSVQIACRPVVLVDDWARINIAATAYTELVGVNESNQTHNFRGYFCPNSTDGAVSGLYRQAGGEGYDGINVYCGGLQQARLSAVLTFTDFAWDKTLGQGGWLTNLTKNGTLLDNLAGMSGENKMPYAAETDNITVLYQSDHELYVLPGTGYGAKVNRRPAGIASNTYIETNTCADGRSLGNEEDASCILNVQGLPDISVTLRPPPPPIRYSEVGQTKNLTLIATNLGPGTVSAADGFALTVELPEGWTPGAVDGCTVSGQVLTCQIDTEMAAAAAPGAEGGQLTFSIPATTNSRVVDGSFTARAKLQRSVPDGDSDPSNDDYNTANDTDSAPLTYLAGTPSLGITKVSRGGAGSFTFMGNNGWQSQTLTTTQGDRRAYGDAQILDADGVETTITETMPSDSQNWKLSSVTCIGMEDGGTVTFSGNSFTLSANAIGPDSEIFCRVTNDTPEMQVTKESSAVVDANNNGRVDAGDTVDFTIIVKNIGPITISNIKVDDPLLGITDAPLDPSTLAPGESAIMGPLTYVLTQQDIYNGEVTNTAFVNGEDPDGDMVSDDGSVTTVVDGSPELTLTKEMIEFDDADGDEYREAGETFTYRFTVQNTGGVRLNDVYVDDPKLGQSNLAVTPANLDPGETGSAEATYVLTQEDVDAGYVDNRATAYGTEDNGDVVSTTAEDNEAIPPFARMSLTKTAGEVVDANGNGRTDAGDTITYSFSVENTGAVTIDNVTVSDPKLGLTDAAVTPGTLAPGETGTASATYTLTQADIDAGEVENTATASGTPPGGGDPVTAEDTVTTPVEGAPELTLTKSAGAVEDANGNGRTDAGDTITYSFSVENSGTVTIENVTVSDPKLGLTDAAVTPGTLAPGETGTASATYTLTQADIDAGEVENTATATGQDPDGNDVTDDDTITTPVAGAPELTLTKTAGEVVDANGNGRTDAGDTITYSFSVENTGSVTIENVTVDDAKVGAAGLAVDPGTLAPGETGMAEAVTYTLTQADIDAGEVENTATASGTPPGGGDPVTAEDTVTTPVEGAPELTLTKSAGAVEDANGNGRTDAGDTITYSFSVENSGTVTIENVTVSDPKLGLTDAAVTPGTLAPGETGTASATYTLTQADIDAGEVENTATASGTPPGGGDPVTAEDTITTPVESSPALTLTKTAGEVVDANGNGRTDAGDTITYTFSVENSGTVTIENVTVSDPKLGLTDAAVTPSTLAPGETGTAEAVTYTLTQADIDAGEVENTATASGTPPGGGDPVTAEDTITTPVESSPALTLTKTAGEVVDANGNGRTDAGDTITYTFSVENSGTVTIENVTVSDPKLGLTDAAVTPSTLAPGETGTAEAVTYTLTQADIDAGEVENTATASGTPPGGGDPVTAEDTITTPVESSPALTLTKTAGEVVDANGNGRTDAGDTITYSFSVENTGAVTIDNVTVSDPKLGLTDAAVTPSTLAPGETGTAEAVTYTLTQADIDAGEVENTATASGTPPGGGDPVTAEDTVTTPVEGAPELTLTKSAGAVEDANGNGRTDAGDTITYSFSVENSGTVTIENVTVSDPKLGLTDAAVTPSTLAPGETGTAEAVTYTLTQADIDAGEVENTATASGTPPGGGDPVTAEDTVTTPVEGAPELTLTKSAGAVEDANGNGRTDAGDTITYSFSVENTGSVTISNVTVDDAKVGLTDAAVTPGTLAPGETGTASATYTLTQADIDAGEVENTATASGTPPGGGDPVTAEDTVTTPVEGVAELTIEKRAGEPSGSTVGSTIDYTFTVTNTGTVTLTGVMVEDALEGVEVSGGPVDLAPGQVDTTTFTARYTLTQDDLNRGEVVNSATATGTPPGGGEPVKSDPSEVTTPLDPKAELTLVKRAGEPSGNTAGSTISYTFEVTNTGDVNIENITLSDDLAGVEISGGPIERLEPGQTDSTTFTARYTLTQEDIERGEVVNSATVTGTPTNGDEPVESDPSETTTPIEQDPRLELIKSGRVNDADGNGVIEAGDALTYSFEVTNTGNVIITDIQPVDEGPSFNGNPGTGRLGTFTPGPTTLEPGATQVFTATYTLMQADVDNAAGVEDGVTNTATARGYHNGDATTGTEVSSDESSTSVELPAAPPSEIEITKQAGLRQIRRGEKAPFTIVVTNKANRMVSGVNVVDTIPAGFRFVEGSASIDGEAATPVVAGANVTFKNLRLEPNGQVVIRLQMQALSTAGPGRHINRANVTDPGGNRLAPEATAPIEIMVEPVFDCGEIIGKVFDDRNANGYQDEGEPGLPGVRVVTVRGKLITTDKHGRFHVACADLPDQRIGSNFIMKLDERTLPTGYRVTTENPRVVRLTAGKMTKLNFGASLGRVVRLDLNDAAFVAGSTELQPQWRKGIDQLIAVLAEKQSTLRINYQSNAGQLASSRLRAVQADIQNRWKKTPRNYQLNIETRLERSQK